MALRKLTIRSEAAADVEAATRWYEAQQRGLGREFNEAIEEGFSQLKTSADQYPIYYGRFRRIVLPRFPYKLFSLIVNEHAVLFRVLHTSQDHTQHLK